MKLQQYLMENLDEGKGVAVKKGANKSGTQYMLVQLKDSPEKYVVYIQKQNYSRGSIIKTWAFVTPKKMNNQDGQKYASEGIPHEEAMELFNKRLKGKVR